MFLASVLLAGCGLTGSGKAHERAQAIADAHVLAKITGTHYESVRPIGGGFWVIRFRELCLVLEIKRFHVERNAVTGAAAAKSC